MPSISAISAAPGIGSDAADSITAARVPQKVLGQHDFLRLLAAQFKAQDPMKPMEDTAFIAQMAQFTALEQSSAMARDLALLRADQRTVTANSYLGHRVTVAGSGYAETGEVAAINAYGTEPLLVVNGNSYPLSAVLRVEPGLVTVPAPQPATAGGA